MNPATSPAKNLVRALIVIGTLLVLGTVGASIAHKERIKRVGEVVYLELAPVDPRSLIQGDYMALRFALARELQQRVGADPALRDGATATAPVTLDARGVAHLADEASAGGGPRLRYRLRRHDIWIGTNAYFFEEGSAQRYAAARYGEFRVDRASGEAVLVGLRDAQLAPL